MPANPKFIKLLESVKEATSEGRLEWSEAFNREYRTTLDEVSLRTGFEIGEEPGSLYYYVYLYDKKDDILEALTSEDDQGKYKMFLREFAEVAKRRARKVDDLLDRLIKSIGLRSASVS
jgi:hypothetical protein